MKIEYSSPHHVITFETHAEVRTVRTAYLEQLARLEAVGNDSSISEYDRNVSKWEGSEAIFRTGNTRYLLDQLRALDENTEAEVDKALDMNAHRQERIRLAADRYHLGHTAVGLVEGIEAYAEQRATAKED